MNVSAKDELQDALRPMASLISKSEKARQKLAPGTWRHAMLGDNLKALRFAFALLSKTATQTNDFTPGDLQDALRTFAAMIGKSDKALSKFSPGTSQHTLLQNRLRALRVAEVLINGELENRSI